MNNTLIHLGAINKNTNTYVLPSFGNKKDEYVCPDCNQDLILCQGQIISHHFRHFSDKYNDCIRYNTPTESQIHKDAKILVQQSLQQKKVIINRHCCSCTHIDEFEIPSLSDTSSINIEYSFEYENERKIADIAYIDNGDIIGIFEIYNTHKTDDACRPEPWFEFQANDVLNSISIPSDDIVRFNCIRKEKCDECVEKDNMLQIQKYNQLSLLSLSELVKNIVDLEFFVRYTLGQRLFTKAKTNQHDHLRFYFDAQSDTKHINHNNNIINLFNKYYKEKNKSVVIATYKGLCYAKIISSDDNKIYDYSNICDKHCINYSSYGTVDILIDILKRINSIPDIKLYDNDNDADVYRSLRFDRKMSIAKKVDDLIDILKKNNVLFRERNNVITITHPISNNTYRYSLKSNVVYYQKQWITISIYYLIKWYKSDDGILNIPRCPQCNEYGSIVGENHYRKCDNSDCKKNWF